MKISPVMVIRTEHDHLPTDGGDSVIAIAPDNLAPEDLRELADDMAALVDCQVHHAEFVITTDPDVVRTFGVFPLHQGCPTCDAGVQRAVEHLEQHPFTPMLVGRLHWAGEP